eukprot:1873497-Amphidinium_carterae.1
MCQERRPSSFGLGVRIGRVLRSSPDWSQHVLPSLAGAAVVLLRLAALLSCAFGSAHRCGPRLLADVTQLSNSSGSDGKLFNEKRRYFCIPIPSKSF